jgi:hypothetical protein
MAMAIPKTVFAITLTMATLLALAGVGPAQAAPQSASAQNAPAQAIPDSPAPDSVAPEPTVAKPAKTIKSGSKSETPKNEVLTVAGYPGEVPIVQLNDKSYVDLDQLARLTKGSLTFKADQIILAFSATVTTPAQPAEPPKPKTGFSKAFEQASIEQMGVIREWRSGIAYAIEKSYPLGDDWVAAQRRNADKSLALATAASSTEDDRGAVPLLSAELNHIQNLSDNYLAMRQNAQYIPPDFLDSDSQSQQVLNCARGLAAMFAGGKFEDVAECH